jgi:hypothetical protein
LRSLVPPVPPVSRHPLAPFAAISWRFVLWLALLPVFALGVGVIALAKLVARFRR